MNKDFILNDMMQESDRNNAPRSRKPKSSTNQLQLHVASVYQDIYELLSEVVILLNKKTNEIEIPQ